MILIYGGLLLIVWLMRSEYQSQNMLWSGCDNLPPDTNTPFQNVKHHIVKSQTAVLWRCAILSSLVVLLVLYVLGIRGNGLFLGMAIVFVISYMVYQWYQKYRGVFYNNAMMSMNGLIESDFDTRFNDEITSWNVTKEVL